MTPQGVRLPQPRLLFMCCIIFTAAQKGLNVDFHDGIKEILSLFLEFWLFYFDVFKVTGCYLCDVNAS